MGFNWVDLVIILTLLVFILDGFGRPLISEVLDFISFLLAFFSSFLFYNIPGKFFEINLHLAHGLSLVFGFITVWILSEVFFYTLVLKLVRPLLKTRVRLPGEKFLAAVPAFLRGLIFIALILVVIATFPIRPDIKIAVKGSLLGSKILESSYRLETPVKNVFGGTGQDTLTFLTIKPKTNETVDLGFHTSNFSPNEQVENAMIDLVNKERVNRNIKPLVYDAALRNLARDHSGDMLKRGYFSHFTPEGRDIAKRADEAGIDYFVVGENLAYAPSLELAHQGLMNSEGHRANILSTDFNKIGIGVMDAGVYGLMFTQVFSN